MKVKNKAMVKILFDKLKYDFKERSSITWNDKVNIFTGANGFAAGFLNFLSRSCYEDGIYDVTFMIISSVLLLNGIRFPDRTEMRISLMELTSLEDNLEGLND
jgi:hypothetical protein